MPLTADTPTPTAERILWAIQDVHLDEAEFMFEIWEAALA